ncbi:helix-turn-helix domain-containing protein [Oceanobacillus sp. 1P07AA]|uniref:helix-turn-helix domain-containing protein n=1 Tax=Oceanobacillus sp. 1P07AA TaxID=3132293 RepID=UPI0039A5CE16
MEINLQQARTTETIMKVLEKYPHKIEIKLDGILVDRNMTQGQLHKLTGIRMATISEFVNGKKGSVNFIHLVSIMAALRITDISEIISVKFDKEVEEAWKEEMVTYQGRGLTSQQQELLKENVQAMYT